MLLENVLLETTREQQKKSMRSGDGDVVDEVVVEIKSAVVGVSWVYRLRISTTTVEVTPLRQERSKETTPHTADSTVGRSLALFVDLSITYTYLSTNSGIAYSTMLHNGAQKWERRRRGRGEECRESPGTCLLDKNRIRRSFLGINRASKSSLGAVLSCPPSS